MRRDTPSPIRPPEDFKINDTGPHRLSKASQQVSTIEMIVVDSIILFCLVVYFIRYITRSLMRHMALRNAKTNELAPRASFLGLPTELRFMIYDVVKDTLIHQPLLLETCFESVPPPRLPGPRNLHLPLRDLARSCKLFAQEIRDHRKALPASERCATLLIQADEDNCDFMLTHAPCPAKDLKILKLVYNFSICFGPLQDVVPMFNDFSWTVRGHRLNRCLPAALEVQVYFHVKQWRVEDLLDEGTYNEAAEWIRDFMDDPTWYGEKTPQKQRLMEFTVEPWRPLLETS